MTSASRAEPNKFAAYRARKKAAGRREVRMWLPDVTLRAFEVEARRQAALLDHTADEQDAAAMMRDASTDAWDKAD